MKTNNKIIIKLNLIRMLFCCGVLILHLNTVLQAQTSPYSGSLQDERKLPLCTPGITPASTTLCSSGSSSTLMAPANAPYLWSNGSTTQSNTVSPTSTTTYTVVCGNGCNRCISTVTVGVGTPTTATTSASASGLYTWVANGLTYSLSGTYTYTSLNPSGCTNTQILNLTILPVLNITTLLDQPIQCHGTSDASVQVQGIGTGPFTYNHNGGAYSNTYGYFQNLGPGSHTFCVKDANGNIACAPPLIITDPPPLAITFNTDNLVSCLGNDGKLSVNITGGTSVLQPYLTVWTNTANPTVILNNQLTNNFALSLSNLSVGNYNVAIEDDNGCFLNQTGSLLAAPPIVVSASWTPIPCNGGTTTIIPSATGGMPSAPLTYTINGIPVASSYVAGTYTVMATDAKGCTGTTVITVTQPPIDASSINVTSCNSYAWSANGSTYTSSGVYVSTSLNASGCVHTSTLNLTINTGTNTSESATACNSYTWAVNGATFTSSGIYTYTSLNVNGCSEEGILNLTIASPIIITSTVTDVSCLGGNDGSISYSSSGGSGNLTTLIVQGGVSSLSVSSSCASFCANVCTTGLCWSGINNCWCFQPGGYPAALLSAPTNLVAGTYAIVVLDNVTGCSEFVNLVVSQPTISCNTTLSLVAYIQGYWNGSNSMVPVLMNQGQSNTLTQCDSITVELRDAIAPYVMTYSTACILNTDGTANVNLSTVNGSYYIVIKHRNGLETWSANPVAFNGSPILYNFTTASSQAYGSNQIEVAPGVWAIYSGEINKDENIDLLDMISLETDISNFAFGYLPSDINGDGNVDLLDIPYVEANVNTFIFATHP